MAQRLQLFRFVMNLRLMSNLRPIGLPLLLILLTAASALAAPMTVRQAKNCHGTHTQSNPSKIWQPLIPLDPRYRGEELGLYYDPEMKSYWNVKYFSEKEKEAYELVLKDGVFVNRDGHKITSEFNNESHEFEHGLILIDSKQKVYFLPADERGRIHHSSLSNGQAVIFAGTAVFIDGKLRELSDRSGHYKPDALQTLIGLRTLRLMRADLRFLKLSGKITQTLLKTYLMTEKEVQAKLRPLFEEIHLTIQEIQALLPPEKSKP